MNETHFTPGPLKADLDEAYKVREANGAQVAIVTHLNLKGRRPSSETAANTHLFAAAPDLYAALEEACTSLVIAADQARDAAKTDSRWIGVDEKLMRYAKEGQAALSQARGEDQ